MSTRTSATRYAKALLEVASRQSDASHIEQQLTTFVETLDAHQELRQALTTPSVPAARKRAIVTAVAERIGMDPTATKLLGLLAYRDRCAGCAGPLAAGALTGGTLACPHCRRAFDLPRAGRCRDDDALQLQPVPLLRNGGPVRVALGR